VVHLGRSTCHAISGRGDLSTRSVTWHDRREVRVDGDVAQPQLPSSHQTAVSKGLPAENRGPLHVRAYISL